MKEDLKHVPGEVRNAVRETDERLGEMAREKPTFAKALDLRLLLLSAAVALVLALLARLLGLGYGISVLLFLLLFVGLWIGLARAAAARKPNRPAQTTEPQSQ